MFQRAWSGAYPRQFCHHLHPQLHALRVTSCANPTTQLDFGRPEATLSVFSRVNRQSPLLTKNKQRRRLGNNTFLTVCKVVIGYSAKQQRVTSYLKKRIHYGFSTGMVYLKQRSFHFVVLPTLCNKHLWLTKLDIADSQCCKLLLQMNTSNNYSHPWRIFKF